MGRSRPAIMTNRPQAERRAGIETSADAGQTQPRAEQLFETHEPIMYDPIDEAEQLSTEQLDERCD